MEGKRQRRRNRVKKDVFMKLLRNFSRHGSSLSLPFRRIIFDLRKFYGKFNIVPGQRDFQSWKETFG
jgi:hypothetical protein